ncbi:MAG: MaoC/PaaZ C-terminal domain-containing protein [Desulfobacteria bacterium]
MGGRYFEELNVGDRFVTMARTITETDIVNFVALAGFYEELFMNMEYVKNESVFQKRIAPGALVYSIAEGLLVALGLFHATGIAFLGLKEMKMMSPVACNDTIRVEIEVIEKSMTKKPDRGVITSKHEVKNQKDAVVMVFWVTRMVRRKKVG